MEAAQAQTATGRLLARGGEAAIWEHGPGTVLRRYDDQRDVTREVTLMRHVTRHGIRVPHVHSIHRTDGHPTGMVLERIDGPSLIEAVLTGRIRPTEAGQILADLHQDLHRVPLTGLEGADPGDRSSVIHLDLHPANILLADEPVIIDWSAARTGPGDLDTAVTALIVAAAAGAGIPAAAGDAARHHLPPGTLRELLEGYLGALELPPASSLPRAETIMGHVGAQPPGTVAAARHLVEEVLAARE